MFSVGQKVVCIDDKASGQYMPAGFPPAKCDNMHGLKRGRVYTIRETANIFGLPSCRLVEIVREYEPVVGGEMYFSQRRFRPIVETKTDISVFKEMLAPSKTSEVA